MKTVVYVQKADIQQNALCNWDATEKDQVSYQ